MVSVTKYNLFTLKQFEKIEQLAVQMMKIYTTGCTPLIGTTITVHTGLKEINLTFPDINTFRVPCQNSKEVRKQLQMIYKFLGKAIAQWRKYVSDIRTQYYHLNHFTTSQLVLLETQLKPLDKSIYKHVDGLLKCVNQEYTEDNLHKYLQSASNVKNDKLPVMEPSRYYVYMPLILLPI